MSQDSGVTAIRSVLLAFNGLKAGQTMKRLYDKFYHAELAKGSQFFMELHMDAIDWDTWTFEGYKITYYSTILEWYHNLSIFGVSSQGLCLKWTMGLAKKMHGNMPIVSWEAIYYIGAVRPDGKVVRFFPHLQYVKERPLVEVFDELLQILRHIDIEFDETTDAKEH
jgi:hypothetical protein